MAKVNLERRAEIGQEKRARTRAQLLAAASALFAKRSWASVTIDDLVREAGVAKGTFYVHFEDMHALTIAVADELIRSFDELIQPRRAATSDPLTTANSIPSDSPHRWFLRGLLTNILNPKVGIFYVTFLPLFIPAHVNVILFSLLLAGIHAFEGIIWFAIIIAAVRPLEAGDAAQRIQCRDGGNWARAALAYCNKFHMVLRQARKRDLGTVLDGPASAPGVHGVGPGRDRAVVAVGQPAIRQCHPPR